MINVLWVTNIMLPAVSSCLGKKVQYGGGWMEALLADLSRNEDLNLAVATIYDGKEIKQLKYKSITYYLLPFHNSIQNYEPALESAFLQIREWFQPDIIHLHGTEYPWKNAALSLLPPERLVISLQGLLGICVRYYLAGLSCWDVWSNLTLRDLIKRTSIYREQKAFQRAGEFERKALQKVAHVIGRTSWDRVHALAVNPKLHYHFCNENLRSAFYGPQWNIETKENFSLFLSQGAYPLKGLHIVLKAMYLLKANYPDLHLYVAGNDITSVSLIHYSSYGKYLKKMIKKYDLRTNVTFTGPLDADSMVKYYLRAHVFICPSAIENSPNSLGEAQLLGVPCIASYVGGIPDMAQNGAALLYRFEEWEMLAALISSLFVSPETCCRLSGEARKQALLRHNRQKNALQMHDIYYSMITGSSKELCKDTGKKQPYLVAD